jgi:hypothetical protein
LQALHLEQRLPVLRFRICTRICTRIRTPTHRWSLAIMIRMPLLCLLLMTGSLVAVLGAADTEQSIPIFCQNVQPGTHFASQLTAVAGQEVAANEYILTFDQAGATIATTTGTVIATTTATPSINVLSPDETAYDYPADDVIQEMTASGIAMPEILIVGGSSAGVGPYGVVSCALAWFGDSNEAGVSDTFFWTAQQPAIQAGTPVLSLETTTPNGTAVTATVGTAFSFQVSATNSPTFYSLLSLNPPSFSPPPGLNLNPTTGVLSGTPTSAGSWVLELTAGNAVWSGSEEITLNIAPSAGAPQISSAVSATATIGAAFSYQITASQSPTGYAASDLPNGLTCNIHSGLVSGTPTVPGTFEVTLTASNAGGSSAATVSIVVAPAATAPVMTNAITYSATVGTPFTLALTATNAPVSFALGVFYNDPALGLTELPPGLTFTAATGVISGTPTASGIFSLGVYASNAFGLGAISLIGITIAPSSPPVISSSKTALATVGSGFSYQITASNSPTGFQAGALAPGLGIDTATGVISGTPTTAGIFVVVLKATGTGGTGVSLLTITIISSPAISPPIVTSASNASAQTGVAFTYTISGSNTPTSFSAAFLPVGLTLNSATGVLSGTPAVGGTCSITIIASNAGGSGSAVLTLIISGGTNTATGGSGTSGATTSGVVTGGGTGQVSGGGSSSAGCGLGAGTALLMASLIGLRQRRLRQPTSRP